MSTKKDVGRHHALKHLGTDRQCKGKKADGGQCTRHVVSVTYGGETAYGTTCARHGGKQQKPKLLKELQSKRLATVIKRVGTPVEIDPAEALLQQVWEAAGNVAWLRERIKLMQVPMELDPRMGFVEGDEEGNGNGHHIGLSSEEIADIDPQMLELLARRDNDISMYGPNHLGDQALHVLLKWYNDERDRLVRYVKVATECGIAERQQRMTEGMMKIIAQVVLRVLEYPGLGLDANRVAEGRRVAAATLREYQNAVQGDVHALAPGPE